MRELRCALESVESGCPNQHYTKYVDTLQHTRAGASGPAGPVLAGPIFCRKVGVSNSWPNVSAMVNCEQLL